MEMEMGMEVTQVIELEAEPEQVLEKEPGEPSPEGSERGAGSEPGAESEPGSEPLLDRDLDGDRS
jgi:hypothetical protein